MERSPTDSGSDLGEAETEGKTARESEKDTSNVEEVSHIEVLCRGLIKNHKHDLKVIRDLEKSLDGLRYDCDNSGTAFESDTNKTHNSSDKAR